MHAKDKSYVHILNFTCARVLACGISSLEYNFKFFSKLLLHPSYNLFIFVSAKIASQNRVAANRSLKSAKHNAPRQGKGGLKPSKNLSAAVPSSRSKSIVNKKRG